jgi:hypothetical protein
MGDSLPHLSPRTTIPAGTVERGERKHRQLRRHFRHVAGGSMSGASGFASGGAPGSSTCNKIGRFVQRSCGNLGPVCCFSQPKQDRPLTHEALFSDHVCCPRGIPARRRHSAPAGDSVRGLLQSELQFGDVRYYTDSIRTTVYRSATGWQLVTLKLSMKRRRPRSLLVVIAAARAPSGGAIS